MAGAKRGEWKREGSFGELCQVVAAAWCRVVSASLHQLLPRPVHLSEIQGAMRIGRADSRRAAIACQQQRAICARMTRAVGTRENLRFATDRGRRAHTHPRGIELQSTMAADAAPSSGGDVLDDLTKQVPAGTVIPPRGVREVVEKTAGYVGRNGAAFEDRLRSTNAKDSRLSFIFPDDPYHAFYQWRLAEIKAGRGNAVSAGREHEAGAGGQQTGVSMKGREARPGPEKPEDFRFSARMPNISALDLEVVRLTALFTAKNGRSWMTALSQREAGNFQFDFLRPQHSLYQFFSKMVDQYTELLAGGSVDGGRPERERKAELQANVRNRFRVLERARKRAEWAKHEQAQKVAQEEKKEKDRIAYQQIDWHDFVVVETVVFDSRDEEAQLPPPTTLNDLQSASLEQKAAMSIDPSRRIEEAFPTFGMDQHYPQQPYPPPAQPQAPSIAQQQPAWQPPPTDPAALQAETDAARAHARAALSSQQQQQQQEQQQQSVAGPKIRSDYVPRAAARKQPPNTQICPNCHQAIPNDEIANHMRIEMLDPQWRDQNRISQQRSATTNLSTADVARNLKRLASQRTDVFDPVTGRVVEGGGVPEAKRIEVEGVEGNGPQAGSGVEEQVRRLHEKYKG